MALTLEQKEKVIWGLENLLQRSQTDAPKVDEFISIVEDFLSEQLKKYLVDICTAMEFGDAERFEILTDYYLPQPGDDDMAEIAAVVNLDDMGALVLSLHLIYDPVNDINLAAINLRLEPTEEWDAEELDLLSLKLDDIAASENEDWDDDEDEDDDEDFEDDEDEDDDEHDHEEEFALYVELEPDNIDELEEIVDALATQWIEIWREIKDEH